MGEDSRLPSKNILDMLRRREVAARARAEAHVESERRCRDLLEERLDDERREHSERLEALDDARKALHAEELRRLDVEVELGQARECQRRAEVALEVEETRRLAAESAKAKADEEVIALKVLLEDDQALRALDEAYEKAASQRSDLAALQKRLGFSEESRRRVQLEYEHARADWSKEREALQQECNGLRSELARQAEAARLELGRLRESGAVLQETAESVAAVVEPLLMAARAAEARSESLAQDRDDALAAAAVAAVGVDAMIAAPQGLPMVEPPDPELLAALCGESYRGGVSGVRQVDSVHAEMLAAHMMRQDELTALLSAPQAFANLNASAVSVASTPSHDPGIFPAGASAGVVGNAAVSVATSGRT